MLSIPSFESARVLVVGDVMLDRYWYGDTARVSPEAPVPVVVVGEEERRLGGAANVALNLARVGAQTRLLGVIGGDAPGETVRGMLEQAGVHADLLASRSHPTIAKLRVVSRSQQLIRLDFEKSFALDDAFDATRLQARYVEALAETDVVVCSDYGKGTLARIEPVIAAARTAGVPVLVDPKGRDWQRYAGATLITPNLQEFEAVAGMAIAGDHELAQHADALRARLSVANLLITRSEKGMSLFSPAGHRHLPARAQEVFDVTGAGDTVIALLAAGLGAGLNAADAAAIANLGASIVVAKLGTATVSPAELERAARSAHNAAQEIMNEDTLAAWVADARADGARVVMTNGCFDLLHPGHIAYLEAARALGDWLVVAVNDDASVRRLKGEDRPLNGLSHRLQVLRGLSAVDRVVAFAEDTPERLICRLCPDVLVKGGDYRVEDVAGGECVRKSGGEVRILDFVDGYSTTEVIDRVRGRAQPDDR